MSQAVLPKEPQQSFSSEAADSLNSETRVQWSESLRRIVMPLIDATSIGEPNIVRLFDDDAFSSLEALSRSACGLAPWCELEGTQGAAPTAALLQSIENFFANQSLFNRLFEGNLTPQVLVEAALFSQALLRAPTALTQNLNPSTRQQIIRALRRTRHIKPCFNNWLLFPALVECGLRQLECEDWDCVRIDYALQQFEQWYLGDGFYGDGSYFAFDYYNSFIIHPMLVDLVRAFADEPLVAAFEPLIYRRAARMATHIEAMISPEGTFPPVGRSLAYRFGVLHSLAQAALYDLLPPSLDPSAVRCAMTAVLQRFFASPSLFDQKGRLTIGFVQEQPDVGESYISQGSCYFCTTAFLPLGLPESHRFWSGEDLPWTSKSAWTGLMPERENANEGGSPHRFSFAFSSRGSDTR